MLQILLLTTFISLLVGMCLIRFSHLHESFSADHDLSGVQKFHARPVPRIGGIPIAIGLVAGCFLLAWLQRDISIFLLLIVALPAFAAGILEDVTKSVGPLPRLLATFVSAILGFFILGAALQRLNVPGLDVLLSQFWILSLLLTVVAVGGVAHAVNIIDGYNGLSGVVSIFIFLAIAYVAFKVQDMELVGISFAMVGSIAGFLFWNYPRGLIFAGDGGAYLVGFMIAEVSVLLVARHATVSPWFPMLCVIYPVFETLFSIYRRKFLQGRRIGHPDALHLHQLVYMRLVRWMVGSKDIDHKTMRNSLTSPYLWGLSSGSVVPAMLFWNNTKMLICFVAVFMLTYVYLYRMIIHFRTPGWMLLRKSARN
ncbi:MraY family glycosyltransferase [Chromobacterium vaccinii]|uniref:MraY family glycosyltransferase n=1 Tax=Chromobacterium vaccinii TaxID=1108595 RepID=UPI000E1314FC|nr:glycosyltransferase [Chromobacterium vaccinii]SUX30559.1 Undecaprenyl-phosphate alpha-N-acetylglucosaminyl 1-phosphate transferase [Chromobacterium vaccinii]